MGNSPFRSLGSAKPAKASFTEADHVNIARQLLEEHAMAREAASQQLNQVCGNCKGAGSCASTVMPTESMTCWACQGSGKPNDQVQSLPVLSAEDNERIWKIGRLVQGPHGLAVVRLIREYFPDMYSNAVDGAPN